jgi:hypothetical protein
MFNDYSSGDSGFWQEPDFLLADIISGFVNRGGMELGITLFIKGLVITGVLVSERDYLEALSKMFANQAKKSLVNPSRQDLKNTEEVFDFTGLAEDVDLADDEYEENDDFDDLDMDERHYPTIRHLHLKDPVIIQPQPAVTFTHSQVSILRIRLKAVDGWMVGKVNMDADDLIGNFPPPPPPNEIRH